MSRAKLKPKPKPKPTRAARPVKFGVVDTTFSRVDMGAVAIESILAEIGDREAEIARLVVPGVKDLAAAVRQMIDAGAEVVVACGMVGAEEIDKVCGHESSLGLMWLRANTGVPILEVFIHMDEPFERDALGKVVKRPTGAKEIKRYERELAHLSRERTREHALNAVWMTMDPEKLLGMAGTGQRQGYEDAGPVRK